MCELIGGDMRSLVLLAGLFVAMPCYAQEVLTVDQCRADARLWSNQDLQIAYKKAELRFVEKGTKNQTEFALIPFKQLLRRQLEIGNCVQIESTNLTLEQLRMYNSAEEFIQSAINDRYFAFIKRHNLRDQFIKEDEAGER
jgi:hypothetical protein